jgi:hypothetical protein
MVNAMAEDGMHDYHPTKPLSKFLIPSVGTSPARIPDLKSLAYVRSVLVKILSFLSAADLKLKLQ